MMEYTGARPYIDFEMYVVEDDATPILSTTANAAHPQLVMAMRAAGEQIVRDVQRAYARARREYTDSPTTIQLKGYSDALFESGKLKEMVENAKVTVEDNGVTVLTRVSWDVPEAGPYGVSKRRESGFEYLWVQEFGSPNMKTIAVDEGGIEKKNWILEARPFFLDAIQRSETTAPKAAAAVYSPIIDMLISTKRLPREHFGVKIFPSMFTTTFTGFMAYFIPPSKMYAYMGAATDIAGAFTGTLLTEKQMFGWGRQYMWGQIGATRKTIRRKFRRKLWD